MEIKELYELFRQHPHVTTDTRSCEPGSIYVALRGERFDGNAFAGKALESGCAAVVVDDASAVKAGDDRYILVDNALDTLQRLAARHRRQLGTPIVQITGTNGKTTTKELTTAVLSRRYRVHATRGNLNNHIGVPRTLLEMNESHEIAVVETGASHPGEIAQLSEIVGPDCGLITNVGMAHLEGFGSFEGVVRTKSELYDYLRRKGGPDAFVFLHGDNDLLREKCAGLKTFTYGSAGRGFDVEGEVLERGPFLKLRWRCKDGAWHEVQTRLVGAYNLANALAAAAVGVRFGVDDEAVSEALAGYEPTNNRSEWMQTAHNRLIVDAYNANPTSMSAALDNFDMIEAENKMLILGEMRELGEASLEAHRKIVERIAGMNLCDVWLVGEGFAPYNNSGVWFPDVEAVEARLAEHPVSGRLILVKGSNSTKLYRLPEKL